MGKPSSAHVPLNACQDSCDIVGRAPPVLKNIETELSGGVNIWMEHLADELDRGRLVRVLFLEVHYEPKGSILEGGIRGADDDRIPVVPC